MTDHTQARSEEPPAYTAHDCRDLLGTLRELPRPERHRVELALELARRIAEAEVIRQSDPIRNSVDVARFLRLEVAALECEIFGAVYLDNRNRAIHAETVFRGSLSSCHVHPREILRDVIHFAARGVILYHNHPSGNPEPSHEDRAITRRIAAALEPIGVGVLDHLILGDQCRVYSFADHGDLP